MQNLGKLYEAAICFRNVIKLRLEAGHPLNPAHRTDFYGFTFWGAHEPGVAGANIAYRNFAGIMLSVGHLNSIAFEGYYLAQREVLAGNSENAIRRFRVTDQFDISASYGGIHLLRGVFGERNPPVRQFIGLGGIWYAGLLLRIGRLKQAEAIIQRNLKQQPIPEFYLVPRCQLLLADLAVKRRDFGNATKLIRRASEWGISRNATEIQCWSALIGARAKILEAIFLQSESNSEIARTARVKMLQEAGRFLEVGLRIARDCQYGIYHIDLLIERARFFLVGGEVQLALNDLRIALDEGIQTPDAGFPKMLAATDSKCGYAWAIAEGLYLRAQCFLLQAAQMLGCKDFMPENFEELPGQIQSFIKSALDRLAESNRMQKKLKDSKTKEIKEVLHDLNAGVLTRYPLKPIKLSLTAVTEDIQDVIKPAVTTNQDFDVFLSHNSKDKPIVRQIGESLKALGFRVWLDEWELVPGRPWQEALEEIILSTKAAAVLVGADGLGPWEIPEMRSCLSEFVSRKLPVIPVLLPNASTQPALPLFLKQFTWVDLRGGLTKDGLDQFVWGITGKKP